MFEKKAVAHGWMTTREKDRVSISHGDAGLRLRYDPVRDLLWLEITHGFAPHIWWLDLFSGSPQSASALADEEQPTLADSIEYGLDLMQPGLKSSSEGTM
jgi:hypothetical protein